MSNNKEIDKEIHLPFEEKRFDLGVWVYNHQVGLCITLGLYLFALFVLLFGYITLKSTKRVESIAIDMQTLAELIEQRDKLKESIEQIQQESAEIEDVTNRVSNENAEGGERTIEIQANIQDMLDEAAELQRAMAATRAAYENEMAEMAEYKRQIEAEMAQTDTTHSTREDVKVQGNVTVSYSLINPIRNATRLEVPAYLCEGGGEVKVQITVERGGMVSNAKVIKSAKDECLNQYALYAAYSTEFNISQVAPTRHTGTITYIFVAQ